MCVRWQGPVGWWTVVVAVAVAIPVAMAAEPGAGTSAPVLIPVAPETGGPADLHGEVRALRTEVRDLRDAIEVLLTEDVNQLRRENAQLRAEVRRLQSVLAAGSDAPVTPSIPRPTGAAPLGSPSADEPVAVPDGVAAAPLEIVAEWGRTPEEAASVGADTTSLKGLVGWVPGQASDAALAALGRALHERFRAFDNVNIEIFSTEEAARAYAEENKLDRGARVLSLSRFARTGRDVVTLTTQGVTREVTP